MIKMKQIGDWIKCETVLKSAPGDLKQALAKALLQEGLYLLNEMRKNFRKVTPPNAQSTIKNKGSSVPLVDNRDFYNSMQIVPAKPKTEVFIGIPASTPRRGGKEGTIALAEIHEQGKTIVQVMTDRQRKFLHKKFGSFNNGKGKGGTGVIVIIIPPRPFIRPTFEQNPPRDVANRILDRTVANLKILPVK